VALPGSPSTLDDDTLVVPHTTVEKVRSKCVGEGMDMKERIGGGEGGECGGKDGKGWKRKNEGREEEGGNRRESRKFHN